ncbi:MAG TPA: AAA family ATPase, partial [Allocoleopsis sp.]
MNSEQAFEFVNKLFLEKEKTSLSQRQKDVVLGIWEDKTYQVISAESKWAYSTVKETASDLFKSFSKILDIEVNKANFVTTVEQLSQQTSDKIPPSPKLLSELTNPFVPQQGRVDNLELFFNREREIRRVFEVLNSGSSVALIGEEGIGKSSLLWKICQLAESHLQSSRQSVFLDLNWVNDENDFYSALCHEVGIPESKDYSLTRNLRDRRILLAIDNVGKMTWVGFTRGVRDRLRGLAEGSTAPLKLILAASEPLERLFNDSQDEGKTSPLAG